MLPPFILKLLPVKLSVGFGTDTVKFNPVDGVTATIPAPKMVGVFEPGMTMVLVTGPTLSTLPFKLNVGAMVIEFP